MFRLAHLSDIHLGPLPRVSYRELASKRITGYINWQRNRRRHMHDNVLDQIVDDVRAQAPDHVVITGDLVNLALDAEIEAARLWLEDFLPPDRLSLVPGNHDAYVPGSLDKVCRAWGSYMTGDDGRAVHGRDDFPFLRVRGPLAIIGVSSARSSAPFMASGYFREKQGKRLRALLEETQSRGLFRVVLIHHPPVRGATAQHKRLFGIGRFQRIMRDAGAELVLHGHTHLSTVHHVTSPHGETPVVGVAAAGQAHGSTTRPAANYNLFEIERLPGGWSVKRFRRGLAGPATGVVELSRETMFEPAAEELEPARDTIGARERS